MQHGEQAMRLLCAVDTSEAAELAADLDECNRLRQQVERETLKQVEGHLAEQSDDVLAVFDESWHAGVVGLVAGRLARKHGRPAAVGFVEPGGHVRVSLRGVPGFSCWRDIAGPAPNTWIISVGTRVPVVLVWRLRTGVVLSRPLPVPVSNPAKMRPVQRHWKSMVFLTTGAIHAGLVERLNRFEPCGQGNPACLWLLEGGSIVNRQELRGGAVRLRYAADGGYVDAIAFRAGAIEAELQPGCMVSLVGRPQFDRFRGHGAVQFVVEDVLAR